MWAGGGSLPTSEAGSLHHGIAAHGAQLGGRTEVKFKKSGFMSLLSCSWSPLLWKDAALKDNRLIAKPKRRLLRSLSNARRSTNTFLRVHWYSYIYRLPLRNRVFKKSSAPGPQCRSMCKVAKGQQWHLSAVCSLPSHREAGQRLKEVREKCGFQGQRQDWSIKHPLVLHQVGSPCEELCQQGNTKQSRTL